MVVILYLSMHLYQIEKEIPPSYSLKKFHFMLELRLHGGVVMEYGPGVINLDSFIGQKVKLRRSSLGITQVELGEKLGVSFQQIQKYENGKNRISASTLFQISTILGVSFSYFVNGYAKGAALRDNEDVSYQVHDDRESILLLNYFSKIEDPDLRRQILDLVEKIASLSENN